MTTRGFYDLRRHSGNSKLVGLTSALGILIETIMKNEVMYKCNILVDTTSYCFVK